MELKVISLLFVMNNYLMMPVKSFVPAMTAETKNISKEAQKDTACPDMDRLCLLYLKIKSSEIFSNILRRVPVRVRVCVVH